MYCYLWLNHNFYATNMPFIIMVNVWLSVCCREPYIVIYHVILCVSEYVHKEIVCPVIFCVPYLMYEGLIYYC